MFDTSYDNDDLIEIIREAHNRARNERYKRIIIAWRGQLGRVVDICHRYVSSIDNCSILIDKGFIRLETEVNLFTRIVVTPYT